ncbi:MAG: nucleotidyltransferase family protein [Chloroflexota bacterium]|nr:nucleotidyltransferase family protein [Chloroflexota bacterium]
MPPKKGCHSSLYESVAAVVLAAGEARRYGEAKQLLTWKGNPFVHVVANTALEAGLSPVIVVTGAWRLKVSQAVENLPVEVIHNPHWQKGQSTSVKAGLRALPPQCGASIFLLADQPHIPSELLRSLVKTHKKTNAPLIAPQVDGQITSPTLFDRITFPDFETITGDQGGRALFERYPPLLIPWPELIISLDVDTPDDYQALLKHNGDTE